MKRIKSIILLLIIMFIPKVVNAASANISVTGNSYAVVGNTVTVTVTVSSSSAMGAWQMDLNYDSSYLTLIESTAESGGSSMAGVMQNASGVKSKSYTFTFRTKQSGSAKVSVNNYLVLDPDDVKMDVSSSSKTITIRTQAEIEASYSDNAYLRSITVDTNEAEVPLTPVFSKDVYEYSVEVENDVEVITLSARKDDSSATMSGTGEKTLKEGNNRFEIKVTAEKGNTKTYVVNINRKELNPIPVVVDGKEYTYIRNIEDLITYGGYTNTTIMIGEDEIPALKSDVIGITLVGIKDDDGNVYMYTYEDNKVNKLYFELSSTNLSVIPLDLKKKSIFKEYKEKEIDINGIKINAYVLRNNSKIAIIYGKSIETGEDDYYLYDINNKTIMVYDDEIIDFYEKRIMNYKYVLAGFLGFIVLLLLILIIRKPKKKKEKKNNIDSIMKEEIKLEKEEPKKVEEIKVEEIPDEEEENILGEKPKKKKTTKKKTSKK